MEEQQKGSRFMVDTSQLAMEMAEMRGELHALRSDLMDIKERIRGPKLGVTIGIGGTAATVLLSLGVMALKPVVDNVASLNEALIRQQKAFVEHARDGHPVRVVEQLNRVDAVHRDEHNEQEEDIGELRDKDSGFEVRMDDTSKRVTQVETRLEELANKVVGRTGDGFHREDYESIVKPRLDRHEQAIRELRRHHVTEK